MSGMPELISCKILLSIRDVLCTIYHVPYHSVPYTLWAFPKIRDPCLGPIGVSYKRDYICEELKVWLGGHLCEELKVWLGVYTSYTCP